jgi:hypothetical protein
LLGALYPAFWGIAQLGTGALSDRIGRKWLISAGMLSPGGRPLALVAGSTSYGPWIVAAVLLGLGTAMVSSDRRPVGADYRGLGRGRAHRRLRTGRRRSHVRDPLPFGYRPLIGVSRSNGSTDAGTRSGDCFRGTGTVGSRAHTTLDP